MPCRVSTVRNLQDEPSNRAYLEDQEGNIVPNKLSKSLSFYGKYYNLSEVDVRPLSSTMGGSNQAQYLCTTRLMELKSACVSFVFFFFMMGVVGRLRRVLEK